MYVPVKRLPPKTKLYFWHKVNQTLKSGSIISDKFDKNNYFSEQMPK